MPQLVIEGQIVRDNLFHVINQFMEDHHCRYSIVDFHLGSSSEDPSSVILNTELDPDYLVEFSNLLQSKGAELLNQNSESPDLNPSEKDKTVPDNFYSTTNHPTDIFLGEDWVPVKKMRMDGVIVVAGKEVVCKKLRDVVLGDMVVCGTRGIRIHPPKEKTEEVQEFAFMSADTSSERRTDLAAQSLAEEMKTVRSQNGKIAFVAGPVLVHTGGGKAMASLVQKGFVHSFLGNNAIAVHDLETNLYGTSLGVNLENGHLVKGGHKNHMRAINAINKAGSIQEAVEKGIITGGIMYHLVKQNIPFSLAGSIRDDGPLPDTQMDLIQAQEDYARLVEGADLVVMLSTMLHSIGTGNMLGSHVKVVCVDINPATVAKLRDRGSAQTVGVVTDVSQFVKTLDENL